MVCETSDSMGIVLCTVWENVRDRDWERQRERDLTTILPKFSTGLGQLTCFGDLEVDLEQWDP